MQVITISPKVAQFTAFQWDNDFQKLPELDTMGVQSLAYDQATGNIHFSPLPEGGGRTRQVCKPGDWFVFTEWGVMCIGEERFNNLFDVVSN